MNNETNLLITLSNGEYILQVAIKFLDGVLNSDIISAPLEPENKKVIFAYLPLHCQSFGNIVDVKEIFEIIK